MNNHYHKSKLMINPKTGLRDKFWPAPKIAELIKVCRENLNLDIWIITSSYDEDYVKQLVDTIGRKDFNTIEVFEINELAIVLKSCQLYIGTDTGITKLAISLSIPSIILLGPNSSLKWDTSCAPAGGIEIIHQNLPCSPCSNKKQLTCQTKDCYNNISVEEILKRIEKISGTEKGDGGGTRI